MNIIGVIPARGGSKGIRKKNIKKLNGTPLINYTIKTALSSTINKVIVTTDNLEIMKLANKVGAITPFVRPSNLAEDNSSSIDVAIHALKKMEEIDNVIYDAFMLLQPTTPFRSVSDINNAINILKKLILIA